MDPRHLLKDRHYTAPKSQAEELYRSNQKFRQVCNEMSSSIAVQTESGIWRPKADHRRTNSSLQVEYIFAEIPLLCWHSGCNCVHIVSVLVYSSPLANCRYPLFRRTSLRVQERQGYIVVKKKVSEAPNLTALFNQKVEEEQVVL